MAEGQGTPQDPMLATMLDALSERISRYTVDGHIVRYCNRAWAAGHGGVPEDFVGRSVDELLRPAELDGLRSQLARLDPAGTPLPDVEPRPSSEDPDRWIQWVDRIIPGVDGDEVLSIGRDVTERELAERERREQASLLRLAGSIAKLGGWSWDLELDRITWSEQIYASLEMPPGDPPSFEVILESYFPESAARLRAAVDTCIHDGTPWDIDLQARSQSGRALWVRSVGEAVHDASGAVTRLWGAFQDVTDQRTAELERSWLSEQLTTTLERMDEGLVTLDADWHITFVNPAGARLMGRDSAALVGRTVWTAFPYLRGAGLETILRETAAGGTASHLDRIHDQHLDVWFELDVVPTSRGLVIFLRDVSRRVEREQLLQRTLLVEQQAVESLQHLDRVKTAFLSAVSHELRTPITIVHGMAATLQRLRTNLPVGERERIEDALLQQTEHLRGLLDDLLDVDRLARGKVTADRRSVDVAAIARDVAERHRDGIDLTVDAAAAVETTIDPVHLERIVANLLQNAAKYAPGAPVTLRVRARDGGGVRIEVRDHGPGLPTEELERVFEPFYRADEHHPQPGTGIGLALVADFARIHGGRAWAQETHGDGAWFLVELPDG